MTENFSYIISKINLLAKTHPIGLLQEIRRNLKGLQRLPARNIFTKSTTKKEWAFHLGGRREIQFNIGIEHLDGTDELRYGVAFSFETSPTLFNIDTLIPNVKLFNDFLQSYPEQYADMRMWHYDNGRRSTDYMPTSIPPELITEGVFIFLGKRQPLEKLDYEGILDCIDRFLPLYKYIESSGALQPISTTRTVPFEFRSGFTPKVPSTRASLAARELDITLRHNVLQEALFRRLTDEYGTKNVGGEKSSGMSTSTDIMVRHKGEYYLYEIKTALSARICLRQAIGQLLEYAFWPGTQEATRLVVVGEAMLDKEGTEYLHTLKKRFSLPIEYEQIIVQKSF